MKRSSHRHGLIESDQPLLTREEEAALGRKAFAGDIAARDELVTRNIRLAWYHIRRFTGSGVDASDLYQEALLALVEFAARFNPEAFPGIRFSTYISRCIIGRLKTAVRKNYEQQKRNDVDLTMIPDPCSFDDDRTVALENAWDAIEAAPVKDRHILIRRYGLDGNAPSTLGELGTQYGLSKERIRRRQKQAIDVLRKELHSAVA